jgi:D-alanyl-D-alanine carboxypeptidase
MTAILLNDNVLDLNQKVTVHESDRQPPTGTNFVAGDVLTLRDLLQCLLMESSNTSAHVIARVVGGILLDKDANVLA